MPALTLNVNNRDYTANVSSTSMPLLWVLRDVLGLTGTKYGCGIEVCGACTVLINGQREHSFKVVHAPVDAAHGGTQAGPWGRFTGGSLSTRLLPPVSSKQPPMHAPC